MRFSKDATVTMRYTVALLGMFCLSIVAAFACPADAGEVQRDNLGFPVYVTTDGTMIPRSVAKSMGMDVEPPVPIGPPATALTYTPLAFDIEAVIGAKGDDDAAGDDETGVIGLSVRWLPTSWMKFGPQLMYGSVDQSLLDFSIPVLFYIFPATDTNIKPFLEVNPIHYTVAANGDPLSGHWTSTASANFGVEVPLDLYYLAFDVGASYIFTGLNVPVQEFGGFNAAMRAGVRIR